MKYKLVEKTFHPIEVTFESKQEVSWLAGLLTCDKICNAIREIDSAADKFYYDLYNAIRSQEDQDLSNKLANELNNKLY